MRAKPSSLRRAVASDWVEALLAELEQGGAIIRAQGMLHDAP
jgi:hypothetical protein